MAKPGFTKKDPYRRLAEINRAITTSLNFDKVLELIVKNAAQLVEAKVSMLLLVDQDGQLRIQAAQGIDPELEKSFTGQMEEDVLRQLRAALPPDTEALVSLPVIAKQSLNGLLIIARERRLDPDEQWQLSALADQAAIALQNARLYEIERAEKTSARDASEIARRRLAAIVESTEDAVISKNLEGIIETWNKAAERVFGYRAEEIIGKPITTIIPREHLSEESEILARLRKGERIEHFETVRQRKNGELFDVSLTISPIKNENGRVIGASKIVRDITDSKKSEEQLKRALDFDETVMSSMGEGLYTVDAMGRVTFMNPAAQRLLGWSLQEVIGRNMHQVIHHTRPDGTPFPVEECTGLQVLREGRTLNEFADVFIKKDGTFFDVVYSSSPLRSENSEINGLAVVFRDVSDRKRTEKELADLLERERQARAEAEEANRLKDEFLATLSHELRNPLNVVIGYAEILRRSGNQSDDFVTKAAETIRRNALAQSQLVSDLLDLSRLQMGKLSLTEKPVSISTIVTDAIETVRKEAAAKNISLMLDLDPEVLVIEGDPIRLGQITWNLLNNAVKFTPVDGEVCVSLRKNGDDAMLVVEDTGQGISPSFLPHVFEIFRQADASSARRQGGMGIGLALVKQLVELHGGRVTAESDGAGAGARFSVWIPLYKPGVSALGSERTGATGALKRKFILVVDDSPETTDMLGRLLQLEGAFVESARSGSEAIEIAKRKNFDLVVSDISMPEMDGYQLLRKLRELPSMANVPAVALTGYGRSADVERAREEGFAEHLTKPLDLDQLLQIVRRLTDGKLPDRRQPN